MSGPSGPLWVDLRGRGRIWDLRAYLYRPESASRMVPGGQNCGPS